MALPPGFLDELRGRISLARVAERKVSWDPRKTNPGRGDFWAPCPFHQEKTASFHVDDRKGYFYCFGCHAKGDAIDFVRETENASFIEAVEILAAEAGMPMPAPDPRAQERAEARKTLSEIMEAAVAFYRRQLSGGRAREARAYLDRRGLDAATQQRFEIGYAPGGGKALHQALAAQGIAPALMEEAGLILPLDSGRDPYDRFRDRIMFPIRDARGRAIAFGGRALDPDQSAKYLNSPETPLFSKGHTLFNVGPARSAAGKAGTVIVAEGYMDVIALVQAGIEHAVAPLGTAITEDQLALLWRMADEPVIALDGDAAGQRAAHRLIDLALPHLAPGKSLSFAVMPPGQDPDDLIRAGGVAAMDRVLKAARPLIDLLWDRQRDAHQLDTPERRAGFDRDLRRVLERIADATVRRHYEMEFRRRRAELFAPPAKDGPRRFGRGSRPAMPAKPTPATRASLLARSDFSDLSAARLRESAILLGCINHPRCAFELEALLEHTNFRSADLEALRLALLEALPECLAAEDPAAALSTALAGRGHAGTLEALPRLPQLRFNPRLQKSARPEIARQAIEEELRKALAQSGIEAEIAELPQALNDAPEGQLQWRLREAAEARISALRGRRDAGDSATVENQSLEEYFRGLKEDESWLKKRR